MAKKLPDPGQQMSPVRVAPLGELHAYTVHEHELDIIAAGSPATLSFNVAVALFSFGVSFVITPHDDQHHEQPTLLQRPDRLHQLPDRRIPAARVLLEEPDVRPDHRLEDQE